MNNTSISSNLSYVTFVVRIAPLCWVGAAWHPPPVKLDTFMASAEERDFLQFHLQVKFPEREINRNSYLPPPNGRGSLLEHSSQYCWQQSQNIGLRSTYILNIARIANAVQCHSWLSGNKDCHEFRFSILRIVISVSIVTSLQDCFKIVKIVNFFNNCQNC